MSSLLEGDSSLERFCPSRSPVGSDSGISDDSSTGAGPHNLRGCLSPQGSDTDAVTSPGYSRGSPVPSDPALVPEDMQTEKQEALSVQADHSYALLQVAAADMDALQSVRAENPDTYVFIDLGGCRRPNPGPSAAVCSQLTRPPLVLDNLVSEAVEDELNVLPCTLAIEDSLQDSAAPTKPEPSVGLSF